MQGSSAWRVWPDAGLECLEGVCSLMQGLRVRVRDRVLRAGY